MRKIILVVLFCSIALYSFSRGNSSKEYRLLVNLKNAPFSSLYLLDYRVSHNFKIKGKHTGQFKWEFTIPDSIVENSEFMMLIVPEKDSTTNAYHQVRFTNVSKNIKTTITNIGIQDKTNYIEGEYTGATLFKNENIALFLGEPDSLITGNLICDDFSLSLKNDSSDITVRSIDAYYSWFDDGDHKLSYTEHVNSYTNLAKRYPNSRYLMTYLALNLVRFKSRQDVKKIYENFSKDLKNSKWANRIEQYLSNNFQNIKLINLDSKNVEPLVQDSSKYNLIIFTASWCRPCIEEIPLLKELHKNLGKSINFTYISMDREKDLKTFQSILVKNKIPWRSLYAYKDLERVTDLFSVQSIPLSLLIYPDGHTEAMDIRKVEVQKKLSMLR